jgi:hypothetical protein
VRACILAIVVLELASSPALAQGWSGPFQLTNDTFADVNPAACPEWVAGKNTCLVWQTNRNGNWDIYAKPCQMMPGNGWGADQPVSIDSADDLNPAVAACNELDPNPAGFWCVWERRLSPVTGSIWASSNPSGAGWQTPESVGPYIHTDGDSAKPRIIVIRDLGVDTAWVWVVWTCHDTDGWRIEYAHHAGGSWHGPYIAVTSPDPIRHARLGRGYHDREYGCPLLTWERGGDIFYTEYVDTSWTAPAEVAHSDSLDRNPDVLSYCWMPLALGPWITWESTRDGDTAVYGTAMDTFSIGRRWCDSSAAGNNYAPCGTPAEYTVDYWYENAIAWVTDRDGNRSIYSRTIFFGRDECVDGDSVDAINPTLTTIGLTQNWCIWQSDRNGNWDLFGSCIYNTGIEETTNDGRRTAKAGPTIVRGVLVLDGFGTRSELPQRNSVMSRAALLDISGREVMKLRAGSNDVSGLAPGVYFVREAQAQAQARTVRKVVIQH